MVSILLLDFGLLQGTMQTHIWTFLSKGRWNHLLAAFHWNRLPIFEHYFHSWVFPVFDRSSDFLTSYSNCASVIPQWFYLRGNLDYLALLFPFQIFPGFVRALPSSSYSATPTYLLFSEILLPLWSPSLNRAVLHELLSVAILIDISLSYFPCILY